MSRNPRSFIVSSAAGPALELDDAPSAGMDAGAVRRIGDELGVSPKAMAQALAEIGAGRPGPLSVAKKSPSPPNSAVSTLTAVWCSVRLRRTDQRGRRA